MALIEYKDKSKADNKVVVSENLVANNQRVGYIELSLCVGLLYLLLYLFRWSVTKYVTTQEWTSRSAFGSLDSGVKRIARERSTWAIISDGSNSQDWFARKATAAERVLTRAVRWTRGTRSLAHESASSGSRPLPVWE